MAENRPKAQIDRVRDSALTMQVGDESDGAILSMVSVADKDLYLIKEKSIYRVFLADEIDPERTNAAVPNGNQRIAAAGASSKIVCRSFLTANALMNVNLFDKSIERKPIMDLALLVMNELLAAEKLQNEYLSVEAPALKNVKPIKDRAIAIPSVDSLSEQVKSYIQKIEHASQAIYRFTKLFYDHDSKFFNGFAERVELEYGSEDEFTKFAVRLAALMLLVRNMRSCIEHPADGQKLEIKNFSLDAKNALSNPSIAIVHRDTPQPEMSLNKFFQQLLDGILNCYEVLMFHLASKHTAPFGKFEIAVGLIPAGSRRDGVDIQFGYLIKVGNDWNKFG